MIMLDVIGWFEICDIVGFAQDYVCKEKVFSAKNREK